MTDLDRELLNNQEPFTDQQIGIYNMPIKGNYPERIETMPVANTMHTEGFLDLLN